MLLRPSGFNSINFSLLYLREAELSTALAYTKKTKPTIHHIISALPNSKHCILNIDTKSNAQYDKRNYYRRMVQVY